MISAVLVINAKGELLISRYYRDNVSRSAASAFRKQIIAAKKLGAPVVLIEKCSFMYIRIGDIFLAAVTKHNANPTLVFQYLHSMVEVFQKYFACELTEESVRNNFVLIYELLDETMDHGYPQITAVTVLGNLIKNGTVKEDPMAMQQTPSQMTSTITGSVDWREPGKYKYRKNEVFIDVFEAVNLLMSNKGVILRSDVSGKIIMKTYLTGMPECKFGMNDKLLMDQEKKGGKKKHGTTGIAIDDLTFHRCVNLGSFDHDRTISFVPPDGEFELMKYRITQNVNLPFKVVPVVTEHGTSRVEYDIKIKGNFSSKLFATNVIVKIPVPKNAAKFDDVNVTNGRTKYDPGLNELHWKIKKCYGDASYTLKGHVKLVASITEKQWARPPIVMDFQVPMFTASGLHVRFMKVFEKSQYETVKWVRYMSKAGQYQIRI